jgi:hypothetical protein
MIWATVGAESGSDATVVNLDVKPFVIVIGGENRADRLAWSVRAVLTQNRYESRFDIWEFSLPVTFNANPLNRPTLIEQALVVDGDVVFGLTCDNAGLTACAFVQVNDHSPAFCHLFRS